MSFFHKKMSQNFWATIMPFGPVTLIFYWPKKIVRALTCTDYDRKEGEHYIFLKDQCLGSSTMNCFSHIRI